VSLARRAVAEGVGSALLLAAIVGSGIMAERLTAGNTGLALLANALATAAALIALILALGPVSGAHLNPWVTLASALDGHLPRRAVAPYVTAQLLGAFAGTAAAHLMFGEPLYSAGQTVRDGAGQWLGEAIATFGLLLVILGCARARPAAVAYAVGAYIAAAYWFTASTSFANPAVTLARAASDSFAGIRPADVPVFLAAQFAGAAAAVALARWLFAARAHPAVTVTSHDSHESVMLQGDSSARCKTQSGGNP
jgi:glycerol uptake facilitator-like aquaporin